MGKHIRKEKPGRVGAGKMLCWQSRMISTSCMLMIIGYLSIYCTDTLKMPAALVGTLLMVSKIFDGVTDLFAGYIVDRTKTKIGRGRPYEWCIVGLAVCTWLMFSCSPEYTMAVKCAWVLLMYAMVNSVFFTFLNASNTVYMVRAFPRQEQYVTITSYGSIIVMLAVVGVNVSFPMLMGKIATSAAGWSRVVGLYALPLGAIGILRFFTIKETNDVDVKAAGERVTFKDVVTVLKTNPYIWIIGIWMLVYNMITNMGVGQYYYTHIMHDVGLLGIASLASVIVLPIMFVVPAILKKISIAKLVIIGLCITVAGYLLTFIAYTNFPLLMFAGILVGMGNVPASMLSALMIIDCAEYNEWKGLQRMEGTMSCVTGFAQKIGSAFGVFVLGILLTASGYDTASEMTAVPDTALVMIRMLNSLIPMALYVVIAFMMRFYKLDKNIKQIKKENEEKRAQLLA